MPRSFSAKFLINGPVTYASRLKEPDSILSQALADDCRLTDAAITLSIVSSGLPIGIPNELVADTICSKLYVVSPYADVLLKTLKLSVNVSSNTFLEPIIYRTGPRPLASSNAI